MRGGSYCTVMFNNPKVSLPLPLGLYKYTECQTHSFHFSFQIYKLYLELSFVLLLNIKCYLREAYSLFLHKT